jgi:pimeloyl-ACP methyl ester carboxylesterase
VAFQQREVIMQYYIHFKGGKLYYTDSGEGKAVVLIHGYLESSEIWKGFAEKLSEHFRVISLDLPGHGNSTLYGECLTMEFLATAVKGLIDTLDLRKIFLAGHSLGGYVTLAFLEKYPDRLAGYSLFHSHPFADTPEVIKKREREISIVRSGRKFLIYPENVSRMFADKNLSRFPDALQHAKDIASRLSESGIIGVLNGMIVRPSRLSVMEAGKVPCLWILGRNDNYISCDQVCSRVRLPENANVHILENSGHLGFIEDEETALRLVVDFIEGLDD